MAKSATLTIDITADATDASAAFDKATGSVKEYGDAASTAAKQSRDISGGIEETGDSAANVTTGLRDLGGAMAEMGGTVGAMGTAMVSASVAFEAMDGAATLYKGAQGLASKAAAGFTKVMNLMKIAILTNPIFIIAAIIIAIGVAFVIAYKKSETFRRIVDGAFRGILNVIKAVWNWIRSNWPVLLAVLFGPFGLAVLYISRNMDKIKGVINAVWGWIKHTWSSLTNTLTAPFDAAWSVISGIFNSIRNAIESVISAIKRIKPPSIDLNPFASGVQNPFASSAPSVRGATRAPAAASTGGSGGTVININGALDPDAVARQIRRLLAGHNRRIGGTGAATA